MVIDLGVSSIPMPVFMAVHLAGFAVGAALAYKAFNGPGRLFGYAFGLYALAELTYMGYHLSITTFLLSHTISEVLVLAAVVLAFAGATQNVVKSRTPAQAARA